MVFVSKKLLAGQPGAALKVVHKHLSETDPIPDKKFFDLRKTLLATLGWDHWDEYEARWNMLRFPKGYTKF